MNQSKIKERYSKIAPLWEKVKINFDKTEKEFPDIITDSYRDLYNTLNDRIELMRTDIIKSEQVLSPPAGEYISPMPKETEYSEPTLKALATSPIKDQSVEDSGQGRDFLTKAVTDSMSDEIVRLEPSMDEKQVSGESELFQGGKSSGGTSFDYSPTGFHERLGKGFVKGGTGMVRGIGGALKAMGAKETGKTLTDSVEKFESNYLQVHDPNFVDDVSAAFGSAVTFLLPGRAAMKGAKLLTMFPKIVNLAATLGTTASAVLESAVEAGSVYEEMDKKGLPEGEKREAAGYTFVTNLPLNFILDKWIFKDLPEGKKIKALFLGGGQEAVQESFQEIISTVAQGEEFNYKEIIKSGLLGFIVGGSIASVKAAFEGVDEKKRAELIGEFQKALTEADKVASQEKDANAKQDIKRAMNRLSEIENYIKSTVSFDELVAQETAKKPETIKPEIKKEVEPEITVDVQEDAPPEKQEKESDAPILQEISDVTALSREYVDSPESKKAFKKLQDKMLNVYKHNPEAVESIKEQLNKLSNSEKIELAFKLVAAQAPTFNKYIKDFKVIPESEWKYSSDTGGRWNPETKTIEIKEQSEDQPLIQQLVRISHEFRHVFDQALGKRTRRESEKKAYPTGYNIAGQIYKKIINQEVKRLEGVKEKGKVKTEITVGAATEVETPSEAVQEIIEGKRESTIGTKEFKKRMTAELEQAIEKAPSLELSEKELKKYRRGTGHRTKDYLDKYDSITIEIPGDGSFKIKNVKEELERVKSKVRGLSLEKKGGYPVPRETQKEPDLKTLPLDKITVEMKAINKAGEITTVKKSAKTALAKTESKISRLQKLLDCLEN